jgi:hypothetical protein
MKHEEVDLGMVPSVPERSFREFDQIANYLGGHSIRRFEKQTPLGKEMS